MSEQQTLDLYSDDSLGWVNSFFLGPAGRPWPWQARYWAYAVGAVLFLPALFLVSHVFSGPSAYLAALPLTVAATTLTMKKVNPDMPVSALLASFWAELGAPRPPKDEKVGVRVPVLVRAA